HPDGQNRRRQSVNHDRPRDPSRVMPKPRFERWKISEKLSSPNAEPQTEQSENRDPRHVEFSTAQPKSHDERGRNSYRNREHAPPTFGERSHDHQREHSEQNNHDREHANQREPADAAANFLFHHLAERLPAAPH